MKAVSRKSRSPFTVSLAAWAFVEIVIVLFRPVLRGID
jgi:hypothetical protein